MNNKEKQLLAFIKNGMKAQAERQASLMTQAEIFKVMWMYRELVEDEIWDNENKGFKEMHENLGE